MMLDRLITRKFLSALEQVRYGSLSLELPDGSLHHFLGSNPGPDARLVLNDWSVIRSLASRGDVGFAEAHRDGLWESSDLEALFSFGLRNEEALGSYVKGGGISRLIEQAGYLFRMNSLRGSKRNIQQHYDLGNDFYSLWLDPTMTYSSALYKEEGQSLPAAQLNKYDRLLDRIEDPRGSVLEIGCGWGGFAERSLERHGGPVKGLTLSKEQLCYARERLAGEAQFELQDYRQEKGVYDTIVSIEMFEAVGMQYWKSYFDKVSCCLKKTGKALVQSIVIEDERFDSYRKGSDMIRSYIFPGGMLPSDERFTEGAEASGLQVTDRFEFGADYARTLREWLVNFDKARPAIEQLGFDAPFIRLWRYYLASCAASFQEGRIGVMQYELRHCQGTIGSAWK